MLGTITLTVGQPDGVSVAQKEEASDNMDTVQDEVAPQVNVEKESPDAGDISAVEEKAAEEKPDEANEVGFKKIFRFVGFKFTLKKDKSEEKDPVKLLTVKDKEGEEVSQTDEPTKEAEVATVEEKSTAEEMEADTETSNAKAEVIKDGDKAETADAPVEETATEVTDEIVKEEEAEKEAETTQPSQETTLSSFRKLFNGGLFSNLRKKASIKKTKEEEDKETAVEEETAKTEETAAAVEEKEEKDEVEQETKEAAPVTPVEEKTEPKEAASVTLEVVKSETTIEPEVTVETPAPATTTTEESKQEEEKAEACAEEEKAPAVVTSEPELLSSQEKAKPQGSPLKKLFTGAGLKKLSTKKQKKKDTESKLTESGEQAAEQLQSSTESAEAPKSDSGPSSPEESGEHVIAVAVTQSESAQETDGEVVSDGEKKKEGIIAWSSFKKLVTPKKRVKRSSESEDEATGDKPAKSATLSSSESATLADKSVEEETKEEKPTEEEPKTENTEKLVSSTEEPKKKMDTSVSWEALMCMGGPKKRTRRTSDSDDEETKIEEELQATAEGEQEGKTEATIVTSQESEGEVSTPEPVSSPQERESAWDTLKRMVMPKNKAKVEEKPEESTEQIQSDSEAPKDESSFSLKKFLPGRRKKKSEKQASSEQGSGEEDSDTPAVVPLSEYNEQLEVEQEAPAEPATEPAAEPAVEPVVEPVVEAAAVQTKVSAEERSPSWITAVVEDGDDKHDELSDIPEEAENAATPKSVDTDMAEDETKSESPSTTERRLSTAEMKPVVPAPAAETTPVLQGPKLESAEEAIRDIEVQVCEIPNKTSVTVEDVPSEVASEKTESQPLVEKVESNTNTILEPHTGEETMAICTGLGTEDIAEVAMEEPVMTSIESAGVICDTLSTNMSEVEQPLSPEEAIVTEDAVLAAQLHQGETIILEPAVENSLAEVDIQEASESYEADIETAMADMTKENELIIPVVFPSEGAPVITETVVLVAPAFEESDHVVRSDMVTVSETVGHEQIQVQETNEECSAVETVEAAELQTGVSEISAVIDQASEKMDEIKEEVQQESEIEAQSMVIAQAVIQDAMDKVSDDAPEPEKPMNPTATNPASVEAVATTEKEIEIPTENPVISDVSVVVACQKTPEPLCVAMEVIDTVPLEVVASLDAAVEEEEKPEEGLKEVVEAIKVSEETVIVEEVVEIKEESELKQVEEEQSKEDTDVQEPDVKDAAEEAEPQSVEAESEAPSEEDKEKVLEINVPDQVVLQTAQVTEEPSVDEEAVEEFDSNSTVAEDTSVEAESTASENKPTALSEEGQTTTSAEVSTPSQVTLAEPSQPETEKTSIKCAEVMAQVIEVIEEAVKEIEPLSTEIITAS